MVQYYIRVFFYWNNTWNFEFPLPEPVVHSEVLYHNHCSCYENYSVVVCTILARIIAFSLEWVCGDITLLEAQGIYLLISEI